MITLDVETCGFHGMAVTIQYKIDDGPIMIHDIWKRPAQETVDLIELFCQHEILGFNLTFDWFHICKLYTTLEAFKKNFPHFWEDPLEDHIDDLALCEYEARDGSCVKPRSVCDIMIVARKTKYQVTMERSDIRIKKVPVQLAWNLAAELETRVLFDPILFERRSNKLAPKWKVLDSKQYDGKVSKDFKDIVLKFSPSTKLKALAVDALKIDPTEILLFGDVEVDKVWRPKEFGYAPFAMAHGEPGKWGGSWPEVIDKHINHWTFNDLAREYAKKDVEYTYRLWEFFGKPDFGDDTSILTCMIAAVRWRGYSVNIEGLKKLRKEAKAQIKNTPTSAAAAKRWLLATMNDVEKIDFQGKGTDKKVLMYLATAPEWADHEAQTRAKAIIDARAAQKEIELYDKVIKAKRLHAAFKALGALSDRMSGDADLNTQGIKHTKRVRENFTFAHGGLIFTGGDFDGFEVTIADAVYKDKNLREALLAGKKIHALFAEALFPDKTYKEIVASKGSSFDMYDYGKRGVFALIYGGNWTTLVNKLNITEEHAKAAEQTFYKKYPGIFEARKKVIEQFASMTQPGGIGSQIIWKDPADYVESLFGFRRYFTLENKVCKALFELANNVPKEWRNVKVRVQRRDREQTAFGAVQSALFACAFAIQSSNTRAAANHEIQSSGAQITKRVQRRLWDAVPVGISKWEIQPCNIHDEILAPVLPEKAEFYKKIVDDTVEECRAKVPLLAMEWKRLNTWADK